MSDNDEKSKWYEGKKNKNLLILQKCLDKYSKDDINKVLMDYTQAVELLMSKFPEMPVGIRKGWAIAHALKPDWLGDALAKRVENSMLVSALLLTVTASSFVSPVGYSQLTARFLINCYLNGICSALFLVSIVLGVCFLENGMNRAYCWSDRFCLIIQQYSVRGNAQQCARIGVLMFPMTLILPMQSTYIQIDSYVLYVLCFLCVAYLLFTQVRCMFAAQNSQNIRTTMLVKITDPEGRLLSDFQPFLSDAKEEGENPPSSTFNSMYDAGSDVVLSDNPVITSKK